MTGNRKLILTLVTLTLIAITGWVAGSPEWAAEWLVWALGVGTGGNALEHLAPVLSRRRAPVSAPAADLPVPTVPAAGAGAS